MKIGLITTCQHPCNPELGWGAESYMWDLTESLDKLGHEVVIFGKEGSQCPDHGGLVICDDDGEILYAYSEEYNKMDIIHDFSSRKVVSDYLNFHEIKPDGNPHRILSTNFNVHFLYPKIHKNIVCVSDKQRYLGLQGRSGFENTPWYQQVGYTGHLRDARRVYLGINLDRYIPQYDKEDYILFFNSFDFRKGITIALQLAKEMGFKLVVAGEMKGHLEHQATFQQMKPFMDTNDIKYYTDVTNEEKIKLMRNAKGYLFPSMFEQPWGVVITQAMACGTPVITMNHGAFPEQVIHGETGFLCNNMDDIKTAIQNIDKIDGRACRKDAEKRFDRMLMAKNYLKLYEEVLSGEEW